MNNLRSQPDLVVLSHLRWPWVWQRPQHLVSRFARQRAAGGARTWFVEEPVNAGVEQPRIGSEERDGLTRVWLEVPGPADSTGSVSFDDPPTPPCGCLPPPPAPSAIPPCWPSSWPRRAAARNRICGFTPRWPTTSPSI